MIIQQELSSVVGNKNESDVSINDSKQIAVESVSPFFIDPDFYSCLTYDHKKQLFANNVELVYIETHSKCNRSCWFCPNSVVDRHSENIIMDDSLFHKILNELSQIDYDGDLSFSVYNEPLIDPNIADRRIRPARKKLPYAKLHFDTNGDFITTDIISNLASSGLDRLQISIYVDDDVELEWDYNVANNVVVEFCNKMGIPINIQTAPNEVQFITYGMIDSMLILVHSENHRLISYDRANSVPEYIPIPRIRERNRICTWPYIMLVVQHDGQVMPCCQFRSDVGSHKDFVIGNIRDETIFEIFSSDSYKKFRSDRLGDINTIPCNSCTASHENLIINNPFEPMRNRPRYRR